MHDVFISYSHKDKQVAAAVVAILEGRGIKCFIDHRDINPGDDYAASLVRAIRGAKIFVLLLSSSSAASRHVENELNSAVNAGATILPFRLDGVVVTDTMVYYIGKTHWMDALTPPLEQHIHHLADTVEKYLAGGTHTERAAAYAPKTAVSPAEKRRCRMLSYEELLALGYTASSIAVQLVENDYITCDGIGDENEGSAAQWEQCLQNQSDTFHYLVNGENKIVGDWSIVALEEDAFEEAVRGDLLEQDIDESKTALLCFPDIYHGYILAFSLLPDYRNMENYNLLIDSFLRQMEVFAENGIFFRRWCINVFGKEVEALVKRLGFRYTCDNPVFGKIYTCDFMPLPNIPLYRRYPKLCEAYKNVL